MKFHLTRLSILVALCISTSLFSQTWNWASQVATFSTGGFGANKVKGIAVDANENIYVVGDYGDSALIGGVKAKGYGNGAEMFLAKYNSLGAVSWIKSIGSTGFLDQVIDVTTDAAGDVYICGSFFGNGIYDGTAIAPGLVTVGLIKCNSNGDLQWAKVIPGMTAGPGGIKYAFNSVYAAINRTLVKYELDGDTVWTRTIPTNPNYFVEYRDVLVDVWGCVIVTGQFKGTITYGSTTLSSSSINDPDIFVVMYDANGTVEWAKQAGAISTPGQEDIGQSLAGSQHGEIYVAGQYKGNAGFDNDSILTGNAILGMFVAKYDSEGNFQWVKGSSGVNGSTTNAYGISVLPNDDVLVAASFGIGVTVVDTTVTIAGGSDVLMLRLSPSGARRWAKRSDTFATAAGSLALATNVDGTATYCGGQFNTTFTIGLTTMTIASGVTDGWLGKMTISPLTPVYEYPDAPLPREYSLSQNYPNPFNPTTTIEFRIPHSSRVSVLVYNILGQQVRSLVDENLGVGTYSTVWDGRGDNGELLASGVYFYRLQTGSYTETQKMMLMK